MGAVYEKQNKFADAIKVSEELSPAKKILTNEHTYVFRYLFFKKTDL